MQRVDHKDTERRLDAINLAEQGRGFRFKAVPEDMQALLRDAGLPVVERLKFRGQTPGIRQDIAKVVQRCYHRDLMDESILSNKQILERVRQRGEWSTDDDDRIEELTKKTNAAMTTLFLDGFSSNGQVWIDEILTQAARLRTVLDECVALPADSELHLPAERREEILVVFTRWLDYNPDRREEYTARYAEAQGRTTYSSESDKNWLMNNYATLECVDIISELDDLKDKLHRFVTVMKERNELAELQLKRAKIFADSVESRRDNTEELARVYFTTEVVGPEGKVLGRLAPTYEGMLDFPDEVIQFLLSENYLFHNAIPEEARAYLEAFGFLRAEQSTGGSEASAASPEAPISRTDSPIAATTTDASSENRPAST